MIISDSISNTRKRLFQVFLYEREAGIACDNIKIMPCVEGDRSDCQPEASSIARSRRLRAMVVVEG